MILWKKFIKNITNAASIPLNYRLRTKDQRQSQYVKIKRCVEIRGKRRSAYKQKSPSALLGLPLWGGDDLLSHNSVQYHRRCGA